MNVCFRLFNRTSNFVFSFILNRINSNKIYIHFRHSQRSVSVSCKILNIIHIYRQQFVKKCLNAIDHLEHFNHNDKSIKFFFCKKKERRKIVVNPIRICSAQCAIVAFEQINRNYFLLHNNLSLFERAVE